MYADVWKTEYHAASSIITEILERVFVQSMLQQRWLKDIAAVILANTMVCINGIISSTADHSISLFSLTINSHYPSLRKFKNTQTTQLANV